MEIIRLDPSIPLDTVKGAGNAIFAVWLNEEHNFLWTCIIDGTGEIWTLDNTQVRGQKNIMMGRIVDNSKLKVDKVENTE